MKATEVFKKWGGISPHPLTPTKREYRKRGSLAIEIAEGRDLNGKDVVSVTVLEHTNKNISYRKDLSGLFTKTQTAHNYVNTI